MQIKKRMFTETTTIVSLGEKEITEMIKLKHPGLLKEGEVFLYFTVPSGGDYSGLQLSLEEVPLEVKVIKRTEKNS